VCLYLTLGGVLEEMTIITMKEADGEFEHTARCVPYTVTKCGPGNLSAPEVDRCVSIITCGEAVDPESAARELPRASALAIVRTHGEIVGVGAIKRVRTGYAEGVGQKSGFTFDPGTAELGYVAIDYKHRRRGLSRRIVAQLSSQYSGPLFATTDSEYMRKTLAAAGFVRKGHECKGQRGELSLWIRD
jgi:Acetyltransferase (GNAT) family